MPRVWAAVVTFLPAVSLGTAAGVSAQDIAGVCVCVRLVVRRVFVRG